MGTELKGVEGNCFCGSQDICTWQSSIISHCAVFCGRTERGAAEGKGCCMGEVMTLREEQLVEFEEQERKVTEYQRWCTPLIPAWNRERGETNSGSPSTT